MDKTQRQRLGVQKWINNKGNGIWVWSTGVGKSFGALMACVKLLKIRPDAKILISVPTTILKEQWLRDVAKTKFFGNVTVEVINSILKKSWEVDFLIIDELHTAVSEQSIKIFDQVKYDFFLGLTATLERLDGREELLSLYTKVIDVITTEEAIKNGWLSPFRYYKVLVEVDDMDTYYVMNQKFNSVFAFFNFDFSSAMKCATDWKFRNNYAYKMGYDRKQVLNAAMAWMQLMQKRKKFVMSHPKKFEIAKKIIEARKDKKIITFSATIKDAESLKVGYTLHSKRKKKENSETIALFKAQSSGVLNTSKAANAGLDCPDINCEIRISGTSSGIDAKQILGRGLRYVSNKITEVFTLVIKGTNEEAWFNKAHQGISYITITESQLDLVLKGEEVITRKRDDIITNYRF